MATLREFRQNMQLTQDQFAQIAGIDAQAYSRMERGAFMPKRSTLRQLWRFFMSEFGFVPVDMEDVIFPNGGLVPKLRKSKNGTPEQRREYRRALRGF